MKKKEIQKTTMVSIQEVTVNDVLEMFESSSHEFIFQLIVSLEAMCQDGEMLERVAKHFNNELAKQEGGL